MRLAAAVGLCATLGAGCGGAGFQGAATGPSWWHDPSAHYDRSRYLLGRGQCGSEVAEAQRPACARERALANAAMQILVRVRSRRTRACSAEHRKRDGQSQSQTLCRIDLESETESALGDTTFADVAPVEAACTRNACRALVAIDRQRFAEHTRRAVAPARSRVQRALKAADAAPPHVALARLAQVTKDATRVDAASAIASMVADTPVTMLLAQVEAAEHGAFTRMRVCSSSPEAQSALRILKTLGAQEDCTDGYVIAVTPDAPQVRPSNSMPGGVRATLSAQASIAPLGYAQTLEGHGLAPDERRAVANARADLVEAVSRAIFIQLTGRPGMRRAQGSPKP